MSVDCYNDYEENKLSSCAHLLEIGDFKYSSSQIKAGRICCSKDKAIFCGQNHKTTTVRSTTTSAAIVASAGTVTPTSSIKSEQVENKHSLFHLSYDQGLLNLWRDHLANTDSKVLSKEKDLNYSYRDAENLALTSRRGRG
jgi:hypothetical protein